MFLKLNYAYPGLRQVYDDPPIYIVDNFLAWWGCDILVAVADDGCMVRAPVVGAGAGVLSKGRSSSTCFLDRDGFPGLMNKVSVLVNKPVKDMESPQVGRYVLGEQYEAHQDFFDVSDENGRRFALNGGQRIVTVLVYLNDVDMGGETAFTRLNFKVKPRKGSALVFFPCALDGTPDERTEHAALPAVATKYVSQIWVRQTEYKAIPGKRLDVPLFDI